MDRMLPSEEAARRLGVKVSTLYAYVSRGLLESHPEPGGRRSLFALSDVEQLARRQRGGRRVESRLATVTTGVTQLRGDGPFYRGRAAASLIGRMTFEEVAGLLWQSEAQGDWSAPDLGASALVSVPDRMRWALVMCGATDPLRADLRPESITRAARRVIAALTSVVGTPSPPGEYATAPIAARLAARLAPPTGGHSPVLPAAAVSAALILMADHELATSTLAVRVAASTRADLYDALMAGLATLAGPLHGGASQQAHGLLVAAERDGAARALNDTLRATSLLPGFGHTIYKEGDPRVDALLALAAPLLSEDRVALLHEVMDLADAHKVPAPNCDLALAALSWGTGMPPDAGRTIFTVARLAGWTAHYQEELTERPLRFRARAVYSAYQPE
jgi:citrate synthase